MMLTDTQFAQMRKLEEMTMLELADIVDYERVSDSAGGSTLTEVRQAGIKCKRTAMVSGQGEMGMGGQGKPEARWEIAFPVGTQVSDASEVYIGDEKFVVSSVLAPETFETARYVIAVKR